MQVPRSSAILWLHKGCSWTEYIFSWDKLYLDILPYHVWALCKAEFNFAHHITIKCFIFWLLMILVAFNYTSCCFMRETVYLRNCCIFMGLNQGFIFFLSSIKLYSMADIFPFLCFELFSLTKDSIFSTLYKPNVIGKSDMCLSSLSPVLYFFPDHYRSETALYR